MKHIKMLLHKLLLVRGDPYIDRQSEIDSLKVKLRIKEIQYEGAARLAETALKGFENDNSNKKFGASQAHSLDYLKTHYKDLFDKIEFERDTYKSLDSRMKWEWLKKHFDNQKEMDEACVRELLEFSKDNVNYCKKLRSKLNEQQVQETSLESAEMETRNVSTTPTSDFVSNAPHDLPSVDDYIDD